MNLFSFLRSDNTNEDNLDESQEDDNTKEYYIYEEEVESTRPRKTAKIIFSSGRREEIEFHTYDQSSGMRTYKKATGAYAVLRSTYGGYSARIRYEYEPVLEVSVNNIETVNVSESGEDEFSATCEREEKVESMIDQKKEFYEQNDNAELVEREVDE